MSKIPSIVDVAAEAGVSQRTASRILAGGSPRSKNSKPVFDAARKLGFVLNQQAANLKSGFSRVIGVVVPNFNKPYHATLIQGLHDTFQKLDYPILVWCTDQKDEDRITVLERLLSYQVAGVYIDQTNHSPDQRTIELYNQFLSMNRPLIISGTLDQAVAADYIHIDTQRGISAMMKLHARCGRKLISFVAGPKDVTNHARRFKFFRDELGCHNLTFHEEYCSFGEESEESAYTRFLSMINSTDKLPNAVIAGNDTLAAGVIRACHDENIKVPDDIAVSGSDDIPMAKMLCPSLTTMKMPISMIVKDIAEQIDQRIASRDVTRPKVLKYIPELVVRESA